MRDMVVGLRRPPDGGLAIRQVMNPFGAPSAILARGLPPGQVYFEAAGAPPRAPRAFICVRASFRAKDLCSGELPNTFPRKSVRFAILAPHRARRETRNAKRLFSISSFRTYVVTGPDHGYFRHTKPLKGGNHKDKRKQTRTHSKPPQNALTKNSVCWEPKKRNTCIA